jgi:hypothetical protein
VPEAASVQTRLWALPRKRRRDDAVGLEAETEQLAMLAERRVEAGELLAALETVLDAPQAFDQTLRRARQTAP